MMFLITPMTFIKWCATIGAGLGIMAGLFLTCCFLVLIVFGEMF